MKGFVPIPIPNLKLTLPELISLSAFTLPKPRQLDLPAWAQLRRGAVPVTTRARVRWLDRNGCLDTPKSWAPQRAVGKWPITIWERPQVRRGEPRLYHAFDLLTVQLDSWLRREGLRNSQIVAALRGRWALRYLLLGRTAFEPDAQVVIDPAADIALLITDREWEVMRERLRGAGVADGVAPFVFPVPWLGGFTGGFAKLARLRRDSQTVTAYRRSVPIESLAASQTRKVARVQVSPREFGV